MTGVKTFLGAVGCLIFVAGCGQTTAPKEVPPVKTAAASETQAKSDPKANEKSTSTSGTGLQEFDGMGFQVPSSWKPLQLSDMQRGIIAAKFGIPEAGENISLTLSTSGGSLEDNLARWEGQFSGGDSMVRETISADGQDATLIRLQGRFSPGFGRPDADFGIRRESFPERAFAHPHLPICSESPSL